VIRTNSALPMQLALAVALALPACAGPSEPAQRIKAGDAELYASYVQPYVEAGCATLDCHGDPGRPLRLYSELGLRKAAELRPRPLSDDVDPLAITDAELDDNRRAFAGVALATESPRAPRAAQAARDLGRRYPPRGSRPLAVHDGSRLPVLARVLGR
jgi:hypothetical protein